MSDRVLGGIGLALVAFYAWSAFLIQESFMTDEIGPKTFPLIIATVAGLASLWFMLKPDPDPVWPPLNRLAEIGFAVVVLLLYARLLPELGFVISTAIVATYLTWRLGSRPLGSVVIGVAISAGIFVVFHTILGLSLAEGPFGF